MRLHVVVAKIPDDSSGTRYPPLRNPRCAVPKLDEVPLYLQAYKAPVDKKLMHISTHRHDKPQ